MGERIGLIAGAGAFPFLALAEARKQGYVCVVAALRGDAGREIGAGAEAVDWFSASELGRLIAFFKSRDIRRVLMAGKIDPRSVFSRETPDSAAQALLSKAPDRTASGLIGALINLLAGEGLSVMDPGAWLAPYFCPAGILTAASPTAGILADIEFGWARARRLADEDIGQTLVVKDRAVIAVEGLEGTDETVKRAGRLAGEGIVVLKAARTGQDMRIDVPAVGAGTLRSLVRIGAAALCFEAGRVAFFDRDESLALAEANRIAVLARPA
jgi:UDP-2,3-diacylglucosamine hydrolase